uniref:Cationic amino acid transporter C-terminal domain-containing protein n=2 Tax=Graphocephala atropunctata TaxID=36148 RepID=A0A1B6M8U7_9HEMI
MVVPANNRSAVNVTMKIAKILARRKTEEEEGNDGGTKLKRVLGLADLTMLGVGSTLGLGVYVLAGAVAKTDAGPAVTISFLIAAVASAFAGMCYAEFAARVPKAGSAYVYSYVTVGELAAFIIGWNLILEYIIGAASVARGLSNYIDSLSGKVMSHALTEAMPIRVPWLSPYPDFLSFTFILVVSMLVAWGVKESTTLNNIFTVVNLLTVIMIIVVGAFYSDVQNWTKEKSDIPAEDSAGNPINAGNGGFMPFGVSGIMAGAAKCFYGFVGFDCVATTGEEAKNPKRDIPISIIISLIIIFFAYFGGATVITLMWPYYLQDVDAPLPYVFEHVGLSLVKWIVSLGAVFALCTNMLGCLFPIPRILYAMGNDRLLFQSLAKINSKTHTPLLAILLGGGFSGIMAAMFNLDQLIDMMSIGTLLAYTIVAICVLVLRYKNPNPPKPKYQVPTVVMMMNGSAQSELKNTAATLTDIFNLKGERYPNSTSEKVSYGALAGYVFMSATLCITLVNIEEELSQGVPWAISITSVMVAFMVVTFFILSRQPKAEADLTFKVPLLPLLPCFSICINFYLMVKLDVITWFRFSIWLFLGMLIYVFYSIPNSVEGVKARLAQTRAHTQAPSAVQTQK